MRTVVVVPTYQEAGNVERFVGRVRDEVPEAEVLVVDDASPDGTANLAEAVGEKRGQVTVLRRPGKQGLGVAYRDAFKWAMERDFEVVVQMDCDFSHDPAAIPQLLAELDRGADCAVGSRYVPGGSTPHWPAYRRLLSRWGNRYTAAVLRLGIRDATGGFRAYRASTLEAIDVASTTANGYAFMSELARRMARAGLSVVEVPITFVDRTQGTSKMSIKIMAESLLVVTRWGLQDRRDRDSGRPLAPPASASAKRV